MSAIDPLGTAEGPLAELYRLYWPGLCRYLRSVFGNGPPTPDDIAQMAFSNLMGLATLDHVRDPRAFLYRTARNIAIRQHEREGLARRIGRAQGSAGTDEIDPERILIAEERYELLNQALMRMPPERRRLLLLNRLHGLSYAEIARRTGISQTHVKRLVAQALFDCKHRLNEGRHGGAK